MSLSVKPIVATRSSARLKRRDRNTCVERDRRQDPCSFAERVLVPQPLTHGLDSDRAGCRDRSVVKH